MNDLYIKRYWDKEDTWFYLHFQDQDAIEQIEISPTGKKFLSVDNRFQGSSMLCDQKLEYVVVEEKDFITKEEFDEVWNSQ